MNLQQMKVFLAVVETGSYTAAGKKIGYSQSRVTQMMNALEVEVGSPLFVKNHYGATLSPAGEKLLPSIRRICHGSESLDNEISEIRDLKKGTLNICTYTNDSVYWLSPVIAAFHEKYPAIIINIIKSDISEILCGLEDRSIDFALIKRPENSNMDFIPLYKDPIVVIFPSIHEFSEKQRVDIHDLEGLDFVLSKAQVENDVTRLLTEADVHPNVVVSSLDNTAIMSMVQKGIGVSMLPELAIRDYILPGIEYKELEPAQYRELGIVMPSVEAAGPVLKTFVDFLKRYFE